MPIRGYCWLSPRRYASRLGNILITCLLCLATAQGHTTESNCQKKAESLGWAVGCGCLKYDLSMVQANISLLLPECSQEDTNRLANSVENGLEESENHDEYDFLCLISCRSTYWNDINALVGQSDGSPI